MARMRLARYIALSGVVARRKAEILIRDGVVVVNGEVVTNVATNVDDQRDQVTVDGQAVVPEPLFYVVFNKPKGCITSVSDPWDRATVMDYLPKLPARVKPVGRLDYYSEGVLLLTNDGELAAALLGPKSHIEKTYHVKVRGRVTDRHLAQLRDGVRIGPRTVTREAQVDRLKAKSKHDWLVITLTEGKSRQIHRMLEALDLSVTKLQRVAFAGLSYHGLRVGDARELSQAEVNGLRMAAGLKRSSAAVSRGAWAARREDTEVGRRAKKRVRDEKEALEKPAGAGAAEGSRRPTEGRGGRPNSRTKPRGQRPSGERSHSAGPDNKRGDSARSAGRKSRPGAKPGGPRRSGSASSTSRPRSGASGKPTSRAGGARSGASGKPTSRAGGSRSGGASGKGRRKSSASKPASRPATSRRGAGRRAGAGKPVRAKKRRR